MNGSLVVLLLAILQVAVHGSLSSTLLRGLELSVNGHYELTNVNDACFDFMAGQFTKIGTVCAKIVNGEVEITFSTTGGWTMDTIHLWYGWNRATMPQTKTGSPQIGKFPYQKPGPLTSWTHKFTLESIGLTEPCDPSTSARSLFVAAHAATSLKLSDGSTRTETAWSAGNLFVTKGMWGTYSTLTFQCVAPVDPGPQPPPEIPITCTTSFVRFDTNPAKAQCFLDLDLNNDKKKDFNRWGWTNGPFGPGIYTFNIYAGAGQCAYDTAGTFVGTAALIYDGSTATASFAAKTGFYMEESHLYIGSEILPRNNGVYTVAPGQYPRIATHNDVVTYSDTVDGLSGNIYLVFHQVTCGRYPQKN